MRKTLGSIVDTERHEMTFFQGDLKIPAYENPQEVSKSPPSERKYITCFCFLKSAQQYFDNFFSNLKAKIFEITKYIPKII